MEFHDAANIFPLDEEHIDELADDIRTNGQQVAIETMGGKILDGRRRWLACEKADVEPLLREVRPPDPVSYVLSLNLKRRHLSPTQLSMVGARARALYDELAKQRQRDSGKVHGRGKEKVPVNLPEPIKPGDARDQVGEKVGVSGKTIDAATKVLNQGTEELIAAVDKDLIAVSTAARASSLSEEEQNAIVSRAEENAAKGKGPKKRPTATKNGELAEPEPERDPDSNPEDRIVRGKGIIYAHEAINSLSRIPKNDALRKRGFQLVKDWIKQNP